MCVCLCVCICEICVCIHVCACIYSCVCMQVCIHVCSCMYMHSWICVCSHGIFLYLLPQPCEDRCALCGTQILMYVQKLSSLKNAIHINLIGNCTMPLALKKELSKSLNPQPLNQYTQTLSLLINIGRFKCRALGLQR